MAKFCGKCGSKLDETTGLCPRCDEEKITSKKSKKAVIIAIFMVAIIALAVLIAYITIISPMLKYNSAIKFMEEDDYTSAVSVFEEISHYKDSKDKINECRYYQAISMMNDKKYDEAVDVFETLMDYEDSAEKIKDCNYLYAYDLMENGEFDKAITIFEALGEFENSKEYLNECYDKRYEEVFSWTLDEEGTLTVNGVGKMKDFYPERIDGNIIYYQPWHDRKNEIKKVVIGENITYVGSMAFGSCPNLEYVILPEGLLSIGDFAFGSCINLKTVEFPSTLENVGECAFMHCTKLSGTVCFENIKTIKDDAFLDTLISNVVFKNGFEEIGHCAFGYDVNAMVFSEKLGKFSDSSLDAKIIYYAGSESDLERHPDEAAKNFLKSKRMIFNYNPEEFVPEEAVKTAKHDKTERCGDNLEWYFEEETLFISGAGAIYDYSYLEERPWEDYIGSIKKVVISEGVTRIGNYVFADYDNMESIELPDSLEEIGINAFFDNYDLNSIILPESLKIIEEYAFSCCESLEEIIIPDSVTNIYIGAFNNCHKLKYVKLSSGMTFISNNTFLWCVALEKVDIPDSIRSIGNDAFKGCERYK